MLLVHGNAVIRAVEPCHSVSQAIFSVTEIVVGREFLLSYWFEMVGMKDWWNLGLCDRRNIILGCWMWSFHDRWSSLGQITWSIQGIVNAWVVGDENGTLLSIWIMVDITFMLLAGRDMYLEMTENNSLSWTWKYCCSCWVRSSICILVIVLC